MNDLRQLEKILHVSFSDYSLLERALTHRSFVNENPEIILEDNERLEFLGDAVLDFVVGAYLYNRFPEMNEGELTTLRAALVKTRTLASFARDLDIGRFLRLGYGEEESGGRSRNPILCAAFEAIIGAIYLDQGIEKVQELVQQMAGPALVQIRENALHIDAKSEFQVWAQAQYNITPHYKVAGSSGPDHAKIFIVKVFIGDEPWGEGSGSSKQAAAQEAAGMALTKVEEQFQERGLS